jgi:hypothetical protein
MPFTQFAGHGTRGQIVQIQEVKIDYLPGLASDEKKLQSARL